MSLVLSDGQLIPVTIDTTATEVPGKQYYYKNVDPVLPVTITFGAENVVLQPNDIVVLVFDISTGWTNLSRIGDTGPQGPQGDPGIPILWQGSFPTAPLTPSLNWAYYDTTQYKSFVWDGDTWEQMTQDGTYEISYVTALDNDTVNLTAQKTMITMDTTGGDVTLNLGTTVYDGQAAGVYPSGSGKVLLVGAGIPANTLATEDLPIRLEVLNSSFLVIETGGGGAGGSQAYLGDFLYRSTPKDLSVEGYLPFQFEAVSTSLFPELYAEIGDIFEQAHIDAGQAASGAGYFYPTPVPGSYGRSALPDINVNSSDVIPATGIPLPIHPDWIRRGSAIKLIGDSLPTPLTENTIYYLRHVTGVSPAYWGLYPTEADAIASTNKITLSDTGSGTFKLTQVGIAIDDAMQGHKVSAYINHGDRDDDQFVTAGTTGGSGSGTYLGSTASSISNRYSSQTLGLNISSQSLIDDGNGTPRTSNETRPVTFYEYGYIKATPVIPFDGTPVSGIKYEWELGEAARTWKNQTFTVTHNLGALPKDLLIKVEIRRPGGFDWQEVLNFSWDQSTANAAHYGLFIMEGLDNNSFVIKTGSSGFMGADDSTGNASGVGSSSTVANIRATVVKHNYASPILDQPKYTNQSVTADDGDTVNLIAQKTIINVDTTSADKTITIGTTQYDGQEVIVNNIGTANKLFVIDSNSGFIKDATVSYGQNAKTTVANGKLLNGDFKFIWVLGTDIAFLNSWLNKSSSYPSRVILQNGWVTMLTEIYNGSHATPIFTNLPVELRPAYYKHYATSYYYGGQTYNGDTEVAPNGNCQTKTAGHPGGSIADWVAISVRWDLGE